MICSILELSLPCYFLIAVAMGSFKHSPAAAPAVAGVNVCATLCEPHHCLPCEPRAGVTSPGAGPQPGTHPAQSPEAEGQIPAGATPAQSRLQAPEEGGAVAAWLEEGKEREWENSNELISCSKTFSAPLQLLLIQRQNLISLLHGSSATNNCLVVMHRMCGI